MLKLRKPGLHCWPKQWQRLPSLQGQPWTALPSPWLMPWLHMCKRTFWTTIASTLGIKQTWHTWGQPFRLIPFPWFSFSFTFRWRLCLHLWRWCCLWQLWTLLFTNFSGIGILRFGCESACLIDSSFWSSRISHKAVLSFPKNPSKALRWESGEVSLTLSMWRWISLHLFTLPKSQVNCVLSEGWWSYGMAFNTNSILSMTSNHYM